jgi:RNA recognition motif-containing protein
MSDDSQANAAITALHESSFMERNLVVNEARPIQNNSRERSSFNNNNRRY